MAKNPTNPRDWPRGGGKSRGTDDILDLLVAAKGNLVTLEEIKKDFRDPLKTYLHDSTRPASEGTPEGSMEYRISGYIWRIGVRTWGRVKMVKENGRKTTGYILENWRDYEAQDTQPPRFRIKKSAYDRIVAAQVKAMLPAATSETEYDENGNVIPTLKGDVAPEAPTMTETPDDTAGVTEEELEKMTAPDAESSDESHDETLTENEPSEPAPSMPVDSNDSSDGAEIALPPAVKGKKGKGFKRAAA